MATRRQAREWALQLLVQLDLNPDPDIDTVLEKFWNQLRELERERYEEDDRTELVLNFDSQDEEKVAAFAEAREFMEERVRGVMLERDALDSRIEPRLRNWSLYRLGTVERNVLRLGFWELENCPEIPTPIVINEHVDLAKFFSETKSGRFVNGLLDRYAKHVRQQNAGEEQTFTPQ
jgi:N utilization substance protein B